MEPSHQKGRVATVPDRRLAPAALRAAPTLHPKASFPTSLEKDRAEQWSGPHHSGRSIHSEFCRGTFGFALSTSELRYLTAYRSTGRQKPRAILYESPQQLDVP
jgi:hypothetical protein